MISMVISSLYLQVNSRALPFPFQHKFLQRTRRSAAEFQFHPFGL